jgi:hypothetical protein
VPDVRAGASGVGVDCGVAAGGTGAVGGSTGGAGGGAGATSLGGGRFVGGWSLGGGGGATGGSSLGGGSGALTLAGAVAPATELRSAVACVGEPPASARAAAVRPSANDTSATAVDAVASTRNNDRRHPPYEPQSRNSTGPMTLTARSLHLRHDASTGAPRLTRSDPSARAPYDL